MSIHIEAKKNEIAETVLMPGDPLRAQFIAETFLESCQCYNRVRGMLGYTGYYNGKLISVQGSGMGMPSIGIYSYELFNEYNVKNIIRVGTCGSLQADIHVRDIICAMGACTNSAYAKQYDVNGTLAPIASPELMLKAKEAADRMEVPMRIGNVLSSDIFYDADPDSWKKWSRMGVLAVEMETAALYLNAAFTGKNALTILTVSDSLVTAEVTTAAEREKTFTDMMRLALESI